MDALHIAAVPLTSSSFLFTEILIKYKKIRSHFKSSSRLCVLLLNHSNIVWVEDSFVYQAEPKQTGRQEER